MNEIIIDSIWAYDPIYDRFVYDCKYYEHGGKWYLHSSCEPLGTYAFDCTFDCTFEQLQQIKKFRERGNYLPYFQPHDCNSCTLASAHGKQKTCRVLRDANFKQKSCSKHSVRADCPLKKP